MTYIDIIEIVKSITYKPGWTIALGHDGHRPFVQLTVTAPAAAAVCAQSGEPAEWKSAKHYLSSHMCRQEIVGVVFTAIKQAEEHEMREWFRYRGASIFNAHLDPDKLAEFAGRKENFQFRDDPMVTR